MEESEVVSEHVAKTIAYLSQNLRIRNLLELTQGHADPGLEALEMILPLMSGEQSIDWRLLHGIPSKTVMQCCHDADARLTALKGWNSTIIRSEISAISVSAGCTFEIAIWILAVLSLGFIARFRLEDALVAMGPQETMRRLRRGRSMYDKIILVG